MKLSCQCKQLYQHYAIFVQQWLINTSKHMLSWSPILCWVTSQHYKLVPGSFIHICSKLPAVHEWPWQHRSPKPRSPKPRTPKPRSRNPDPRNQLPLSGSGFQESISNTQNCTHLLCDYFGDYLDYKSQGITPREVQMDTILTGP